MNTTHKTMSSFSISFPGGTIHERLRGDIILLEWCCAVQIHTFLQQKHYSGSIFQTTQRYARIDIASGQQPSGSSRDYLSEDYQQPGILDEKTAKDEYMHGRDGLFPMGPTREYDVIDVPCFVCCRENWSITSHLFSEMLKYMDALGLFLLGVEPGTAVRSNPGSWEKISDPYDLIIFNKAKKMCSRILISLEGRLKIHPSFTSLLQNNLFRETVFSLLQ
jgi:hypothetical protein